MTTQPIKRSAQSCAAATLAAGWGGSGLRASSSCQDDPSPASEDDDAPRGRTAGTRSEGAPIFGALDIIDRNRPRLASLRPQDATPYFSLDLSRLRSRVTQFRACFPSVELLYALKANPHPAVLRTLHAEGCSFEAASWGEIALLLDLGVAPEGILFGTAVKSPTDVRRAFAVGVDRFASDSEEDLAMVGAVAPGARVLLRARADDSASVFQMSRKFGAEIEQLPRLVEATADLGLHLEGVSFNVGSQSNSRDAWQRAIEALSPLARELHGSARPLRSLDLGGGFPERYANPDTPTLEQIASAAHDALRLWPPVRLMAEPGRFLVAPSMTLTTSIIARIVRDGRAWLYLDAGVYNALFEALAFQGRTRYAVRARRLSHEHGLDRYVLAGPTGDGLDVICDDAALPRDLDAGDQLVFERVGAYTLTMASEFNGFDIPRVDVIDEASTNDLAAVPAHASER